MLAPATNSVFRLTVASDVWPSASVTVNPRIWSARVMSMPLWRLPRTFPCRAPVPRFDAKTAAGSRPVAAHVKRSDHIGELPVGNVASHIMFRDGVLFHRLFALSL